MFFLKAEASFDAAHFLARYEGKCHNIHGHHWIVQVRVCGETLQEDGQERGMLIDFSRLKNDLKAVVEPMDHTLIYEAGTMRAATLQCLREEDFSLTEIDFRPTAENFAKYFFDQISARGHHTAEVTVYETPNNCASYAE